MPPTKFNQAEPLLVRWARSQDASQPGFLAGIDAWHSSPAYGRVISSVSTGVPVNVAHHTDYAGHYWIQPVMKLGPQMAVYRFAGQPHPSPLDPKSSYRETDAVVALDVSDLSHPARAFRLALRPPPRDRDAGRR